MKIGYSVLITGLAAGCCFAAAPEKGQIDMGEFSATVTRTTADKSFTGKMFINKDKIRDENEIKGKKTITIIRLDKQLCWVLMDNKQYMEIGSMEQKDLLPIEKQMEQKYEVKSLGKETVAGYDCDVKQYIYKDEDRGVTTQWYSPKLKYMVKTEHKKGGKLSFTQELSDIKEGKIDATLFEVPPGYVKFDPMSQMPAGMKDMMKGMMKGTTK